MWCWPCHPKGTNKTSLNNTEILKVFAPKTEYMYIETLVSLEQFTEDWNDLPYKAVASGNVDQLK